MIEEDFGSGVLNKGIEISMDNHRELVAKVQLVKLCHCCKENHFGVQ